MISLARQQICKAHLKALTILTPLIHPLLFNSDQRAFSLAEQPVYTCTLIINHYSSLGFGIHKGKLTWCGRRSWLRLSMSVVMLSISRSTVDCNSMPPRPYLEKSLSSRKCSFYLTKIFNLLCYMKCSTSLLTQVNMGSIQVSS